MRCHSFRSFSLLVVIGACASSALAIESFFGYQEGTRRNVTCLDGGYFRGMEVDFSHEPAYNEPFLTGLRLLCTSFNVDIEYWGKKADAFKFGKVGKSENPLDKKSVTKYEAICPDGAGMQWLEWREAGFWPNAAGETRIAGFTLTCSDGTKRIVDPKQAEKLPHTHSDGCKTPGDKLAAVEMWFYTDNFNGFTPIACR